MSSTPPDFSERSVSAQPLGETIPFPFVPLPTLAIDRAQGIYLFTPDGDKIMDAAGGALCVNIGHGRNSVAQAVSRSLQNTSYVFPPFETPERVALVERLKSDWLPPHLTRVHFSSGGSDAADAAIRLARLHHYLRGDEGRYKVIGRKPSYHGTTLATLAVGGHTARKVGLDPLMLDFPLVSAPYPLRFQPSPGHEDCGIAAAEELVRAIEAAGPKSVAAFIAEPIVGSSGGAIVPPATYWPAIQEVCRAYKILLIVDEVMTGFGRAGGQFASYRYNIRPDILISGKGLAAGYAPICALFASDEVVEPLTRAHMQLFFYTYAGHPAACAAANEVLSITLRENLIGQVDRLEPVMARALQSRFDGHPYVAEYRGKGMLWAIEIVKDRNTLEPFPAETKLCARIVKEGLLRGVSFYMGGTGDFGDIINIGPPFIITEAEIETLVEVLGEAVDAALHSVATS